MMHISNKMFFKKYGLSFLKVQLFRAKKLVLIFEILFVLMFYIYSFVSMLFWGHTHVVTKDL